ncbi:tetratricopeptide repeat protein [Hugenholtzia roseola]|uniref:tetratricopeptide repeat protein n=1 Tax=Hugenholtzia roseola TaxID=1002 RepID=UPI00047EDD5D|nr:tetratricopeptide repeat protein [Hugenholtzia roseola]
MKKNILFLILFGTIPFLSTFAQKNKKWAQAEAYFQAEELDKAQELYIKVLEKNPLLASVYSRLAEIEWSKERYKEALGVLTEGIRQNPDSLLLYAHRGKAAGALLLFELALQDYESWYKLVKDSDEKWQPLLNMSSCQVSLGQNKAAYASLMEAFEVAPNQIEVLNNLAVWYMKEKEYHKSNEILEQIIQIEPHTFYAYVNLGYNSNQLEDYEKAITYFNKAVEYNSEEPLIYSNRSFAYYKLGDLEAALKDIEFSIANKAMNAYAYKIRALIFIAKGEKEKACADLKLAEQLRYKQQYGEEVEELLKAHCSE